MLDHGKAGVGMAYHIVNKYYYVVKAEEKLTFLIELASLGMLCSIIQRINA